MTPDLHRKMTATAAAAAAAPGGGGTEWGEEFALRNLEVESGIRSLQKLLNVELGEENEPASAAASASLGIRENQKKKKMKN